MRVVCSWLGLLLSLHLAACSRLRRAAVANPERLWPDGVIPFVVNNTFPGELQRLFQIAMHHWQNHTCLSFVPREPALHKDYIVFTTDKCGCCSYVGRRGDGAQTISIGKNCDKFGIIVHELGHVVGFSHEHTRPDRDQFVEIFRSNIQEGQDYNFDKAKVDEIDSHGETYDFQSIMHYARDTFARGAYLDTILPHMPEFGERPKIGQRTKLSDGDIRQTNKMYRCPACFKTLLSASGEIRQGPNASNCDWRVLAALGERVVLNISTALLPKSTVKSCHLEKQNFVEVRDGPSRNSALLGKLCHGMVPQSFMSSSNALFLRLSAKYLLAPIVFARYHVTCGGDMLASFGAIQSPRYPEPYTPETECIWTITVPVGYRVAVMFRYFNLETHKTCSYDHLELYEGAIVDEGNLLMRLCGQPALQYLTTKASNQMVVKFFSDASIQKTGFHLEFLKEIDECLSKKHNCEHICVNKIGGYECDCQSGFSLRDDGRSCESTCGGPLPPGSGKFSSPNYPEMYGANKKCVWELKANPGYRLVVNFTSFHVEGLKSECEYDFVHLKPVSGVIGSDEVRLCGEYIDPIVLMSQTNELRVVFNSDNSMEKRGFWAEYFVDYDECAKDNGGCEHVCVNLIDSYECQCHNGLSLGVDGHSCTSGDCFYQSYEPFGVIYSPEFPNDYPTSKNCSWHILTTPGHRIILDFDFFDVEDHYACRYDYLSVFDGPSQDAKLIGSYCGRTLPPPVVSSGNQLMVELRSDGTQARRGFNASYASECGGRLRADGSPGFVYSHARYGDRKYPKLSQCIWEIHADAEQGVKLRFTQFDIEKERGCDYDFVAVYDGLAKQREFLVGQFCGDDLPAAIVSSSNGLLVEFVTDDNVEQKGFVLEYVSSPPLAQPQRRRNPTPRPVREPIFND